MFKRRNKISKSNEVKKIKKNIEKNKNKKSYSVVIRNTLLLSKYKEEFGNCRGSNILYYKLSTIGIRFSNCGNELKEISYCSIGNVTIIDDMIIGSMFDYYMLIIKCEDEFISNFVIQTCLEVLKITDINFVLKYIDDAIPQYESIGHLGNFCDKGLEKYLQVPVLLHNEVLYKECIERCNCVIYTEKQSDVAIMNLSDYIKCGYGQIDYIKSLYDIDIKIAYGEKNDMIEGCDEIL